MCLTSGAPYSNIFEKGKTNMEKEELGESWELVREQVNIILMRAARNKKPTSDAIYGEVKKLVEAENAITELVGREVTK